MRYLLSFTLILTVLGSVLAAGPGAPNAKLERDVQDFVYLGDKAPLLIRFHVRIDGKPLLDVWEDFVGKVFEYVDVNGDGVLSKDEAARVSSLPVLFNNGPVIVPQKSPVGNAMDNDKDGKVTREELAGWFRQRGTGPFQFGMGQPVQNAKVFLLAGQSQPPSPDVLNKKLFSLLDNDKDGKLSRAELTRAPDILQKLDADDDELVSAGELNGDAPSNVEGTFVVARTVMEAAPNNSPFVPVLPDQQSRKRLVRQLQVRYGDEEEFAPFTEKSPDLEFRIRLGKRNGKEAGVELVPAKGGASPLAQSVRPGSGGTMLLEFGTTQIELGRGGDAGNPQYARALRQEYLARFREADKDNNGYLDKSEADRSSRFGNLFAMMDRDGDGKLFEKEITAYLDRMKDLQEAAFRSCASLSVKDQGRGLFDMADTNGDGRLGIREMRQMVRLIERLDRDGDGQIREGEIPHKYRLDVKQGPANGNSFAAPAVVVLNKMTVGEPAPKAAAAGPMWFRKMDRNRDGDVSRHEFLGTEEAFRRIDADGDGLISTEEADRADNLFRKTKGAQP